MKAEIEIIEIKEETPEVEIVEDVKNVEILERTNESEVMNVTKSSLAEKTVIVESETVLKQSPQKSPIKQRSLLDFFRPKPKLKE